MSEPKREDREVMPYDVVIIGAGPSGLSCSIRLKQLAAEKGEDLDVCILEKGSEVGAHILSGAVFEPRALDELIPDWADKGAPLNTPAKKDRFYYLTENRAIPMPTPPQMKNHGNYIISAANLCRWLGERAEELGVEIYPGFAAAEVLYNNESQVIGVATPDMGINAEGEKSEHFEPGIELQARQTVFAEGCHGSLTKELINKYDLCANSDPQTYGLGIKEIWEVDDSQHEEGLVIHTVGWPMDHNTYGGSWMYHMENNQISVGYVVGLDYSNPYLSPFDEMQRFKTHRAIRKYLEGGERVTYGARALVEGGYQSLPRLSFDGGILIGDTAGFLNVPKIKGNHTAMKSGMVAAESLYDYLVGDKETGERECHQYPENLRKSWVFNELYKVRNIRPGMNFGLIKGMMHAAFQTYGGYKLGYTLNNHADHEQLVTADKATPIEYPKPDGKLTFDRLASVYISNTAHDENQPVHLKLRDPDIPVQHNLPNYAEPAQRYCPAAVYEVVNNDNGTPQFKINATNCVHCKTCDIKDPSQNIDWTVPRDGGGPNYPNM